MLNFELEIACVCLTMATWFGLENIKHDDEDDGDGHDEDGWHSDNESGSKVTLSGWIWNHGGINVML